MKPLFIIGYMASGKTTFGRALALRTRRPFIDLDEEIEKSAGTTIREFMQQYGEEEFRKRERETLRAVDLEKNPIVACGGGTPCFFDNMDYMNSCGHTLWLQASPERICLRIQEAGDTRPLLSQLSKTELLKRIESHLREREPYYAKGNICLSGEYLETASEISATVDKFLSLGFQ